MEVREIRCEHAQAHSLFTIRSGKILFLKVDVMQAGLVPAVLHELLHAVLRKELSSFDANLEEEIVQALEKECIRWLQKSEHRMKPWRTLIDRRMREPK